LALACAVAAVSTASVATAQPRGQDTYFNFSQAVELPNATLPAGRYLFRLADSASNRHIVQVMSEDRHKMYATLMAIPYTVTRVPEEPEVRFLEAPAGRVNAIKIWFYPGNTTGHEFIYPRTQAVKLAKASGEPVLTSKTDQDVSKSVSDDALTRVDAEGRDIDAARAEESTATARVERGTMRPETNPSLAEQTPAPRTPPAATTRALPDETTRRELPRTASTLPLWALSGATLLAASALLYSRRRSA
jgi:LPXTG-motif cell wall-anchored protein